MNCEKLKDEIKIELEWIERTIQEIKLLEADIRERAPSVREITVAATFLAQFYTGMENILKRIHRFNDVPLPQGDTWHIELFKRFCLPSFFPFPVLFDESLASAISPYRKFRHIVHHGYGFQIDWTRMKEGVENADSVFHRFEKQLLDYLNSLENNTKD